MSLIMVVMLLHDCNITFMVVMSLNMVVMSLILAGRFQSMVMMSFNLAVMLPST